MATKGERVALRAWTGLFAFASVSVLIACGDPMTDSDAGGTDGGMASPCEGAADGTACGAGMVCMSGACVPASGSCGDGTVDTGEQCDDGNAIAFDGCEPVSCTFTCTEDAVCDDGLTCNGVETCGATSHVCERGTEPAAGTACSTAMVADGVCADAGDGLICVDTGCGNFVVETGEDCDDGNDVTGDGCERDCTFSCTADADCADGNVCTGNETCDASMHRCSTTGPLACTPPSACHAGRCDPVDGCLFRLIDMDGDGHAPTALGACGTDCNDMDGSTYQGAEELCDSRDNNCNTMVDETAPNWYVDCDGDGYAADTTGSRESCTEPTAPTGCGGGWTTRRPVDGASRDCSDADPARSPGATEVCNAVDEDCDVAVDEGAMTTYYLDGDGDGYGVGTDFRTACAPTGDHDTTRPGDCDDADLARNPGATELCNNVDENCDGIRDEDPACSPACAARQVLGRTYLFCNDRQTWDASAASCRDRGYRLVSITSMAENDAVHAVASMLFTMRNLWWIGLNDNTTEGVFEWVDFGPSAYTNWEPGEPMSTHGGMDCVLQSRDTGAWRTERCGEMQVFNRVCEPAM